jgi:hypothetical protein
VSKELFIGLAIGAGAAWWYFSTRPAPAADNPQKRYMDEYNRLKGMFPTPQKWPCPGCRNTEKEGCVCLAGGVS